MSQPDWENWEAQLFNKNDDDAGDDDIGADDQLEPTEHDLEVVEEMLDHASKIAKNVFGRDAEPGTVLDVYDRIMAYRINRLTTRPANE